jgi:2-isopropylmalate synthase
VTEDTTRSTPDTLAELFRTAIGAGAHRLCLCDTVGHATPNGVRALLRFTRSVIDETGADVGIDWHGHNDRGLALENALWAAELGADRVHGCVLGIGERCGNTPLDLLLVNMRLLGAREDPSLATLTRLCQRVSAATGVVIPERYPVVGRDAFRTSTGVHAAAIVKAEEKGMRDLSDSVYSGVPASLVGRAQEICIGPMSGSSNVSHWLKQRGIEPSDPLVRAILARAKSSDRVLSEDTIMTVVRAAAPSADERPSP